MKIRQGFVSNSSSSSFILALKKVPETVDETLETMFGKRAKSSQTVGFDDSPITKGEAAKAAYEDIQDYLKTDPNTSDNSYIKTDMDNLVELFSRRYYYGDSYKDHPHPEKYYGTNKKAWDAWITFEKGRHTEGYRETSKLLKKHGFTSRWDAEKRCPEFLKSKEYKLADKKDIKHRDALYHMSYQLSRRCAKWDVKAFLRDNPDTTLVCVEYEDHSVLGSVMEHGNVFRNIPHIVVSNH